MDSNFIIWITFHYYIVILFDAQTLLDFVNATPFKLVPLTFEVFPCFFKYFFTFYNSKMFQAHFIFIATPLESTICPMSPDLFSFNEVWPLEFTLWILLCHCYQALWADRAGIHMSAISLSFALSPPPSIPHLTTDFCSHKRSISICSSTMSSTEGIFIIIRSYKTIPNDLF